MKRLALSALVLAAPAGAGTLLSIPLDAGPEASLSAATYLCADGAEIAVRYVNAGPNRLALLALPEGEVVFAGVIAASGARYVAGAYEWWSRGDGAVLRDATQPGEGVDCALR